MPTSTYDLIASNVLGSSAASVTFSSISASYRDLVLVVQARPSGSNTNFSLRFNSDSGANYSWITAEWNDVSGVVSLDSNGSTELAAGRCQNNSLSIINILDYSASKNKAVLIRNNNPSFVVQALSGRWASNSAVNSIEIFPFANSFAANSTFYLYGVVS